jgi:hypothetical protein
MRKKARRDDEARQLWEVTERLIAEADTAAAS